MDPAETHLHALVTSLLHTRGPVLELGVGFYSTPIISAICKNQQRQVLSIDGDLKWIEQFAHLRSASHKFEQAPDWDACVQIDAEWGLAFVDHAPAERRVHDIRRLKDKAALLVIHDTECPAYGYPPSLAEFAWVVTCKRHAVWTSLASNRLDMLGEWVKEVAD